MNNKIFAVVANYPWDSTEVKPWTKSSLFREHREGERGQYTADNKEFQELAMVYSTNHKTMSQVIVCTYSLPLSQHRETCYPLPLARGS